MMDHTLSLEPSICEGSWGQNQSYKLVSPGYESPTDHIDKSELILFGNEETGIKQRSKRYPKYHQNLILKRHPAAGWRKDWRDVGERRVGVSVQGLWQEFRQTNHDLSQDSIRSKQGERDKSGDTLDVKSEPD